MERVERKTALEALFRAVELRDIKPAAFSRQFKVNVVLQNAFQENRHVGAGESLKEMTFGDVVTDGE